MAFPASSLQTLSADLIKVSPTGELSQGLQVQSPITYGQSKSISSSTASSLVFVDSGVIDASSLLAHSAPGTKVVYLNAIEDAVTQITRTLLDYSGISSVHILSHGISGGLTFAQGSLTEENLGQYTNQIKSWSQALNTGADILLYGCDVAGGVAGAAFIRQLGQLTHADIAASTNITGAGGDWILEATTGTIESALISDATGRSQYRYSLDNPVQLLSNSNGLLASSAVGGDLGDRSVSADGNFVVFSSVASTLVAGDTNGKKDVFLYDRSNNTITLISHTNNLLGQPSNGDSTSASISADGNFVIFNSTGNNLTGDTKTGSANDLFRWNRITGAIDLISKVSTETGNGDTVNAVISGDGSTIAFISTATNLTGAITDDNDAADIFLWTATAGQVTLIDRNNDGTIADLGVGNNLDISNNGRFIAFNSRSQMNDLDNNVSLNDIYVYDGTQQTIEIVSSNGTGSNSATTSVAPRVRYNETTNILRVLFSSEDQLTANDASFSEDIYVAEKNFTDPNNTDYLPLRLVSRTPGGTNGNSSSSGAVFSGNGRYVAFTSNATNLVTGDTNGVQDVFLQDLDAADPTKATRLISRNSNGGTLGNGDSKNIAINDDGSVVAFISTATNLVNDNTANDLNGGEDVFAYNSSNDTLTLVTRKAGTTTSATLPSGAFGGRSLYRPVLAGTGASKTIIYANDAIDLVTGDSNDKTDIFAFDLTTPANTLLTKVQVSQNSSTGAGNSTLQSAGSVSRDGRYAVFTSVVNSLVANDGNAAADIFIRDTTLAIIDPNALKLVSRTVAGASGNQVSSQPFISADGKYVVFTSAASNLVTTDINTQQDVFLYDVTAGTVSLVSKTSTAQGDGASSNASVAVDAGGEVYVTFLSRSTSFGASGSGVNNVFVWKKSTGTIAVVSKSSTTAGGNLDSSTPIISADGKYIAFTSNSTNLTTTNFAGTDTNSSADVFIYDITAATLKLVSQNAGTIGNSASFNPVISDSNGVVAFESQASNLTAIADSNGVSDIFRYDGTSNRLISVNLAGNAAGDGLSTGASISADGNTIAFTSEATNLSDTTDNNTKSDVFVRTLTGTAKTTLISRSNLSNTASNGQSDSAALSADGQLVAFISTGTDLSTQDSSPTKDVFTSSITTPNAKLISASTTGSPNGDSSALGLSRDGGVVVFESNASNLIALDNNNASDIFSRTTRATVSLKVLDAAASEGTTDTGAYEISRTDSSGSLDVKLKLSDLVPLTDATIDDVSFTADMGATVTVVDGIITVKIPDGVAKVTLTLIAIVDLLTEGSENAILNLQTDGAYSIDPTNATGTVVIAPSGTLVTNTLDSGVGSLRQAIANARFTPGADTITFALTNPSLKTITLLTPLDDLNGNITIDGGTSGVILNGTSAAAGTNGLSITGSGNVVKGITVTGFTGNGILIDGSDNTVGGTIAGSGNTVNGNKLGVYVKSGTGNQILGNAITNNTDLGIDVNPIGPITTDPLTLTTAVGTTTGATITGTLTGAPGTYRIEFFSNATTDTVGRTEGEIYLGFQDVTIASGATTGDVSYSSTASGLSGKYISATVTDGAKNTSEFVKDVLVMTSVGISSAEDVTGIAEGNTGTTGYKFNLKLSTPVTTNTTFNYRTVAVAGPTGGIADVDYTAVTSGTVTVLAGSDTAIITIDVKGDTRFEVDKSFEVELFNIDTALYAPGTTTATGVIKNDDLRPTISFESNAVSIAEGQTAPNSKLPFKINLSNESDEAITVTYQTIDGPIGATGATSMGANPDFIPVNSSVTFAPGEISKTVNVEIIADTINEPAETFSLSLSAPTNATFATGTTLEAVGTILPDELPSVGISSAEDVTGINEGNTGTTGYKFNLKLSTPVTTNTTFNYRTVAVAGPTGGIADVDYTSATTGTVTVLAGSDTAIITIDVKGDTRFEVDKSFNVELFGIDTALYAPGTTTATGIIKNDDLRPTISFESNTVSIAEGQTAPNSKLPFKINLSNESDEAITVTYQTIDGPIGATGATSMGVNPDFIPVSPTLVTFAPGEISKTVNVEIIADTIDEPAETFSLSLSAPTNATFVTGTTLEAIGTILPDEQPYVFSVVAANPTILEGATGTNNIAQFTVTLDRDPQEDLVINYSTNSGLAVSGTDFIGNTGILTFLKGGGRSQTIDVKIIGNNTFQGDRDFELLLLEPSDRVSIDPTKASATTLIKEDDLPTLSFKVGSSGDVRGVEGSLGNNGSVSVVVELSEISNQDVTVEFTTLDGTATVANNDYTPRTTPGQKITILAGQKNASVNFELIGDDVVEPDETFFVKLSNPIGATILGSDTQTVIIEDDDARIANQPQISINAINATQTEGNTGTKDFTFAITLNKAPEAGKPVSVTVATTDGIGSNGATVSDNDYVAKTQVITFNPGDPLTQQFTVKVNGDTKLENTETFGIILRNAINGILGTQSAIATITDDDSPVVIKPVVSISPVTLIQNEGNAGTTPFTFRVTLDKAPAVGEPVSVDVTTIDGTAISGGGTAGTADFTAKTQTFTFTSTGALTQDFTVLVNGDTQIEANESFTVELRNAIGATLGSNVIAAATIRDDDTPIATQPRISVSPITLAQNEGNTGTTPMTFRITLDKAPEAGSQVSVDVRTVDGTGSTGAVSAGSNADFIAKTQTFTFTSTGSLTQDFTVLVNGDTQVESNETFTVELRNAIGGVLETTRSVATINNDDSTSSGTRNNISTDSLNDILWRNPVTGETLLWQTNLGPTTLANSIPNTYDPAVWRYGGTADFNKDGSPDFLWHNIQTGEVIIWKVNGNRIEAFINTTINQLGSTFSVPGEWHIEDISDYTSDNKPDILWRNYRTNQIVVWEMDGFNYASTKYISQPIPLDWNVEAIADFTGMGSKSLLWRNKQTGDTVLWKIAGEQWINGTWTGGIDLRTPVQDRNWQVVTTGDINGDRISDVLWQNTATGEAVVWYMGSSGVNRISYLPKPTSGFQIKATGDFNQDGVTDLYLENRLTGQNQIWYLQQTSAGIDYGSTALLPNTLPGNKFLGTGNNATTGIPTLIWRNTLNREIITWQISPSPADASTQISALSDPNVQILWTGDLGSTGLSTVLTRNQQNGIVEIGNLNNGIYNKVSNLLPIDRSWTYRGMGDVNGDGVKDIFWQNLETGKVEIWKLGGNGYAPVFAPQVIPGAEWVINQVADFNADGLADIFWRNSRTNQTYIWLMDGSTIKDSGFLTTVPVDWQIINVTDFDRNGTADFLWKNSVTGEMVTWLMDGKSIKSSYILPTVADLSWSVKSVADYDRDGNPDILWYNSRTKQSVFWKMKDGQYESSVLLPEVPNSAWDLVGTRDFNGDGNLDLLWLNTATGTPTIWYLDKMKYAAVVTLPNLPTPNFKVIGLDDFNQIPT